MTPVELVSRRCRARSHLRRPQRPAGPVGHVGRLVESFGSKTWHWKGSDPMSIFTREVFASAASSPHGLTVGTVADPIRLSWGEVHDQAKRMAGCLAARGIGRARLGRGAGRRRGGCRTASAGDLDAPRRADDAAATDTTRRPGGLARRHRSGDPDDPCRRGCRRGALPDGAGSPGGPRCGRLHCRVAARRRADRAGGRR